MQVHRWCFVYKRPRVWSLPGPDVSRWTWDQRHDREQHFWFLPWFSSVDQERRLTSHFHLWQTWRFQFPHHQFSVPEWNIPTSSAYGVFISQLIRYVRACSSYEWFILRTTQLPISFSNRDTSRNAWNRHWGSFMVDIRILSNNMKFPSHKC